jgi:histidinol-phosphatase
MVSTGSPDAGFLDAALDVARAAASAAAVVIRRHYGTALDVRRKGDASPVTIADEQAEDAIRGILRGAYPDHAIHGEERGREGDADSAFLWLVDPIDGTKSFVRGYSMFSTQIALMHRGELVLGVSSAPAAGETCWARRGGGAWRELDDAGPSAISVSDIAAIEQAAVSFGNLRSLAASAGWGMLAGLVQRADRIRGYGDYYHYHLLARGALDLVIESDVNILDIAALAVIVREAGGVFTDLDGAPLSMATTTVLAGTPALHALAARELEGWRR